MSESNSPTASKWLGAAIAAVVTGFVVVAATLVHHASTLFDYNGKPTPGQVQELSGEEALLVIQILIWAAVVGVFLRRAWRDGRSQIFKSWRLPLTLLALAPIGLAILATVFALHEIIF